MARHGVLVRVPNEHAIGAFPADVIRAGEIHVAAPRSKTAVHVSDYSFFESLSRQGLVPPERAIDLYILAVGCYIADQRISRKTHGEDSWSRRIDLFVPVSDPGLWEQQAEKISNLLGFLSGDYWTVHFRGRGKLPQYTFSGQPITLPETNCVSLFSGGLDSYIGAINLLQAGANPVFIGQYSSTDVGAAQDNCAKSLAGNYAGRVDYFPVFTRVPKNALYGVSENTMRTRSFLFFSIGSLIASSLASPAILNVPENGVISLNLPLSLHRLGSLSTKTTHPYLMKLFQELLQQLQLFVTLQNPFQFKTKGEMVRECANQGLLKTNVAATMSCSHPTHARFVGLPPKCHCGTCLPCLIRRAAIISAWGQDNTQYVGNGLMALARQPRQGENANIIDILTSIARYKKNKTISDQQLLVPGPLPDMEHLELYRSVYIRGLEEIDSLFAAGV